MSLLHSILPSFNRPSGTRDELPLADATTMQTVRPAYRVQETADAFTATVYLPGVTKDGLEISADREEIVVTGRRGWKAPETWTSLYRESVEAEFSLTLSHDASVDVDKINAELRDGVLTLTLPKAEALKPRKIAVD
ncbi:MAG: Hsp20/alpha crystallin family protein [Opitutaceae bacterium]|nr:Hsp20/alpha crystallin family protein [Opitutaceae bacterium]